MQAFVDREEEFDFTLAPYTDLKTGAKGKVSIDSTRCCATETNRPSRIQSLPSFLPA